MQENRGKRVLIATGCPALEDKSKAHKNNQILSLQLALHIWCELEYLSGPRPFHRHYLDLRGRRRKEEVF